ncbi:hypothetical protein JT358_16145 [Micrococcales bacterium 31B]|nr:hypothetical protein [Micrococcales bacterium 31B]
MLNKVPEVTVFFWVIKVLCTTVGETAADYLNTTLNWGLTATSLFMGALLAVVLVVQFSLRRYHPVVYWLAVVLVSVVGTLITDNLTDNFGVPLWLTTAVFAVALALSFGIWFGVMRTLSIHSINTRGREAFYWLTVLITFALGTGAGDLVAEKLSVGYGPSVLLFGAVIACVAVAWKFLRLNPVTAFWIVYVLTRPLGASIGDFTSQAHADGGLGIGTTGTSIIFLALIVVTVVYLSVTRADAAETRAVGADRQRGVH